jgi:hypothetical protein
MKFLVLKLELKNEIHYAKDLKSIVIKGIQ